MSARSLLALACTLFVLQTSFASSSSFNALDFFHGNWTVTKTFINSKSFAILPDVVQAHYELKQVDGRLSGSYHENNTETNEITAESDVDISLSSPFAGVFEMNGRAQFSFELLQHRVGATPSNQQYLSIGPWSGAKPGRYQFITAGTDSFTLTVYPDDQNELIVVLSATKAPKEVVATFWSKWGTTIMMIGFFFMQMYTKGKLRTQPLPRAAPSSTTTTTPAAAAAASTNASSSSSSSSSSSASEGKKDK